jgi:hypothetical protein
MGDRGNDPYAVIKPARCVLAWRVSFCPVLALNMRLFSQNERRPGCTSERARYPVKA